MADRDPKTGHFLPGNNVQGKAGLPRGLLNQIRKDRPAFYKAFIDFGNMTLEETNEIAQNPAKLTNMQASALKFWALMRQNPSVQMYSMAFQIYCIKMDVIQHLVDEQDADSKEEPKLLLSREQKIKMLEKAKELLENEE